MHTSNTVGTASHKEAHSNNMSATDQYLTFHERAPNVTAAANLTAIRKKPGSKHYMLSNTDDGRLQLFVRIVKEAGQVGGWRLVGIWRTWCEAQNFINAHKVLDVEDKSNEQANKEGLRALAAHYRCVRELLSQNNEKQEHVSQQKRTASKEKAPKAETKAQVDEAKKSKARPKRSKKKDAAPPKQDADKAKPQEERAAPLLNGNGKLNGAAAASNCASVAASLAKSLDEVCLELTAQSIHLKMELIDGDLQKATLQRAYVGVRNVLQRLQKEAGVAISA